MKLIVGLGNYPAVYKNTRHNLGAKVLEALVKEYKVKFKLDRSLKSKIVKLIMKGNECLLALPQTYMNLSGDALRLLIRIKNIDLADLLVIHDDMDLDAGKMRFRKKGSSGGHNGVESIIKALNTQDFNRLKLGMGRGTFGKEESKDYVLSNFSKGELKVINPLIKEAVKACEFWVEFGINKAMNEYNQMKPELTERSKRKFGLNLTPHHFFV